MIPNFDGSIIKGHQGFQDTDLTWFLDTMPYKTICVISGNRGGKTSSIAKHYVDRLFNICKVEEKNKLMRKVRCMSSTLPEQSADNEDDNAQYIELKKRIPPLMIEKDISARTKNLVVRRPAGSNTPKTVFEFRSSKQETQDLGKIDLSSVWHDEETPKMKREECRMRLMEEDGDEIFSLTAINPLTWLFSEIWQRCEFIARTQTVADKFGLPLQEYPNINTGIAGFQMATDDNPILTSEAIERIFADITDPDDIALRRYGVFKQISGRIHKTYDPRISYLSMNKYFPNGVPYDWVHSRGIDYHESRTPWSIGWLSVSPQNEGFLWQEFHPSIDGPHAYNTYEIAHAVARKSGDYYYTVNLIDPLANKKQANTLFSTTDDLNRHFEQIRNESGVGTPTWWEGWDTKGTGGRDEVSMRFKNAVRCGVPFNNMVKERGRRRNLPTLWIMNSCPRFNKSLLNWCYGEYVTSATKVVNDPKPIPQQKNSHDPITIECLLKDSRLLNASHLINNPPRQMRRKRISVAGR